jgi:hypothetical protein
VDTTGLTNLDKEHGCLDIPASGKFLDLPRKIRLNSVMKGENMESGPTQKRTKPLLILMTSILPENRTVPPLVSIRIVICLLFKNMLMLLKL